MGCPTLRLVDPERWDREKARPLATPKGQDILDAVEVHEDVAQAVAQSALVFGTTARVGGWRQALLSPEQAAREAAAVLARGERVSFVFGPEDRGLNNDEIMTQKCPWASLNTKMASAFTWAKLHPNR